MIDHENPPAASLPPATEPTKPLNGTSTIATQPSSVSPITPSGPVNSGGLFDAESSNPHEPDSTLTGFLWQLLSSTLADDTTYSFEHQQQHKGEHNGNQANNVPEEQHEPVHIEYLETKHSLIDLSPSMKPTPDPHPGSPPHQTKKSPSVDPTPLSSLFSYGKSLLSQISQPAPTTSSSQRNLHSLSSLDSATREERSSLLDLHTQTKAVILSRGAKLPENTPIILSDVVAAQLRPHLPPLYRESPTWRLIYSLDHHGISLNTLYGNCEANGLGNPVLVIVKDSTGDIFGAFANEGLRVQHGYYGNGSCFLWKATKKENDQVEVKPFKATGANDYLILGESHMIAFGGGEGHFGLWVDQDLYNGHSGPCQTFNNERLSSTSEFVVQSIEIWAFEI
ncbi:UNVERIFIED_CONTAM: oxidation resistance protein 1 [Siphonaria sp. JEL0065]|nr:oxidation resistance protein 1 [Siphonaria sp. JEL0065]